MKTRVRWTAKLIAVGGALCLMSSSQVSSAQNVNITQVEQNIFLEKIEDSIIVINQINVNINAQVQGPGKLNLVKHCKKAKKELEKAERKASRPFMSAEDAEEVLGHLVEADAEMDQARRTVDNEQFSQGKDKAKSWVEWVDALVEDASGSVEDALAS